MIYPRYSKEYGHFYMFKDGLNFSNSFMCSVALGIKVHHDWDFTGLNFNHFSYRTVKDNFNAYNYKILINNNDALKYLHEKYYSLYDLRIEPFMKYETLPKDIWLGAFSLINVHDLDYFLKYHSTKRPTYIYESQKRLEKLFGYGFGWVLSSKTQQKLMRNKYALNTQLFYTQSDKVNELLKIKDISTYNELLSYKYVS